MKRTIYGVALVFFLSFFMFASIPQAQATITTETRYMTISQEYSYLGLTFGSNAMCLLTYDPTAGYDYWTQDLMAFERDWQFGIRVYDCQYNASDPTALEITGGTPVAIVTRDTDGEGIQTATWDCPYTNLTSRKDVLLIAVYRRYTTNVAKTLWSVWTPMLGGLTGLQTFWYTESLVAVALSNSTWTVSYYTYRTSGGGHWIAHFFWSTDGIDTYESKIENIQLDDGITTPTTITFDAKSALGGFLLLGLPLFTIALAKRKQDLDKAEATAQMRIEAEAREEENEETE